ncbi:MAG: RHS repeat protein [Bacteroidales bacterium]|nr:RHS repeat protein [Bacteroidales bacterium]
MERAFYFDALGRLLSESTSVNGSVTATMAYAYDPLGRLKTMTSGSGTNAFSEKAITYDRAGNVTKINRYDNDGTLSSLTFTYTGNRRNGYSYDVNGNVTSDATNDLQSSYNLLNLPAQIV